MGCQYRADAVLSTLVLVLSTLACITNIMKENLQNELWNYSNKRDGGSWILSFWLGAHYESNETLKYFYSFIIISYPGGLVQASFINILSV